MKRRELILAAVVLLLVGCSTKERESGEHALSDELEAIEDAREAADLIEQHDFNRQFDDIEDEANQ